MARPRAQAEALAALRAEMLRLAAKIGAPETLLPLTDRVGSDDETWVTMGGDPLVYRLCYSERGHVEVVLESADPQAIVERVFESVTGSMATNHEFAHRRVGEDSRRQWFEMQTRLMTELNPTWGARQKARFDKVLAEHPFNEAPAPWIDHLPPARGRIVKGEALAPFTWLRVGGPADVLFLPADEADLAQFAKGLHQTVPITTIGVGSNLLVRDGGVDGVVVRLGRPFARIEPREGSRIYAGAAVLDAQLAKAAAEAGIAGLEFYSGIPGTIGGACIMNAGCYGSETKDVLVEAYAINRHTGETLTLSNKEMKFSYRHSYPGPGETVMGGLIFIGALFQGHPDDPAAIQKRIDEISERRERTQPIREKTGGSTFANPPGHSSWKLVDEAGWRGKLYGGAKFSELHSNFLINTGEATAADIEGLGEAVRAEVKAKTGIDLEWEIKRIGRP
jgi:UDP-N-acetylmuramate dehydrogenase